jgi:hypothetical protein
LRAVVASEFPLASSALIIKHVIDAGVLHWVRGAEWHAAKVYLKPSAFGLSQNGLRQHGHAILRDAVHHDPIGQALPPCLPIELCHLPAAAYSLLL